RCQRVCEQRPQRGSAAELRTRRPRVGVLSFDDVPSANDRRQRNLPLVSGAVKSGDTSASVLAQLASGLLSGRIRVIDLTVPLEPATPTIQLPPEFARSKSFSLEEISRYDSRGPAWYWNNLACGEHTGTHFDAPIHWVTGKDYPRNSTDTIPAEKFIAPANVIDVSQEAAADPDFLLTPR